MQLDSTAIVIAQRKGDELIDLSLLVMRRYWKPLLFFATLGALPFALFNALILLPIVQYDRLLMASQDYTTIGGYRFRYLCVMAGTVFLQSPLAMAPLAYFLGQAVFIEQPTVSQVLGVLRARLFSLLLVVGVLRFALVSIAIEIWYFLNPLFRPEIEILVFGFFIIGIIYLVRGFRPFAAEILLLERCPIFVSSKTKTNEPTYRKRSGWIHASGGDLFSLHVGLTVISVIFVTLITFGCLFVIGVLVGIWSWGWWIDLIAYPFALWWMAAWGTVIRFLLYMNTRIRTEGWEIELRMRAEAQRFMEGRQ